MFKIRYRNSTTGLLINKINAKKNQRIGKTSRKSNIKINPTYHLCKNSITGIKLNGYGLFLIIYQTKNHIQSIYIQIKKESPPYNFPRISPRIKIILFRKSNK